MKSSTNRGGHCANPLFSAFVKALLSVMLLLVGNVAVKAQTEGSDFTFEEGRCYSKWVINSRIGKFNANTTNMGFATFDENGDQVGNRNDGDKKKLDYVPGLVAKGIIEATQYYSQYPWAKPWFLSIADFGKRWYQTLPGGGTPTTEEFEGGGSLDDINGFKLYITLYELAKDGGVFADANVSSQAETAINNAIKGLKDHNKNYVIKEVTLAGNDVVGGWFHKKAYNNQMWLDGQYMGPALLAQIINYNNKTNNVSTDDWKTIIKQLDIVWKQCWNETDRLLYHAFEANGGTGTSNSHADLWEGLSSTNFHSASYWGRACGWYFLALVDILAEMDKANLSSNRTYSADYTRIKGYLTSLAAGLKAKQDANTGGWYQILDRDGTYSASEYDNGQSHTQTYNYIESSATAIFAAAYLKAIRLGYLSKADYGETATNAYKCIVNNFFAKDGEGVHIFGSCRSAGLGSDKTDGTWAKGKANFRDGSNAYYLLGSDVTRVAKSENITEGKVLGAFILAATEYERLHTTLVQDLPATSTVGTALKLGLSGIRTANDALSYKWYKNGDTPPVAETAEYAPTEAGTYKCEVLVKPNSISRADNSYTITSKEVTVSATTEEPTNPGDNTNKTEVLLPATTDNPAPTGYSCNGTTTTPNNQSYGMNGILCYILSKGNSCIISVPKNVTVSKIEIIGTSNNNDKPSTITVSDCTSNSGTLSSRKEAKTTLSFTPTAQKQEYTVNSIGQASLIQIKIYTTSEGGSTDPSTTYTIKYDLNGVTASNAPAAVTVNEAKIKLPETNPTATGYNFIGWYTDKDCTTEAKPGVTATPVDGIITLYAKWEPVKSSDTNTTFGSGTLDGTTLTVPALGSTVTGSQNIAVTLPKNANAKVTSNNATFADGILTYTAPAAGKSMDIVLEVTAEDGKTKATYTIKVSTKPAPGSMAEYTATFTLDQLKTFGSRTTDIGEITSADNALTLKAVAGTKSGKNVEADNGGAKMQTTSSFILTPTAGVKIKKVSVFTNQSGRHLTSNPSTDAVQSTADNKMWEYTFNSIEEAITFTNANTDNITVSSINVVYEKAAGDGKTALSAKFNKDMIEWYVNDAMPELPKLTVTAIGVENYTDYTVKYSSSDANVVKVNADTGALTVVEGIAGGSASITAVVTPTDANADKYVSTSTLYTVNIKPLKEPVVTVQDMTIYNTVGVHPQPVVTVYVRDEEGNDIVLDPRYYTLSYTPISGDILESSKQGDFILAGSAGNWTTGSAVVRVTCSPEDEARTLYHIMEADATFNVKVVAVGDKLTPTLGGVTKAKMNAGTTREFVKSVLYNGIDITSEFNCEYSVTKMEGVTDCKVSKTKNGILSFTAGTLNTGVTEGKATITITATPNTDNEEQYREITGTIVVTIGKYTDFKSVTLNSSKIEVNIGDVLQNFKVVVLDESGNEVPEDDYTMIWGSSAPGIVGLVGDGTQGIFNAVSEGQAIVRVYIQKDGYADMKGECVVTVKDPGKYAVPETLDVKIGDELKADGLTLTLGGWMFKGNPDLSSYNATTETFGNASVKWGSPAKDNNKPVGFTHNITMKDQKNARQEFGSNCQPESYGIYNGTIKEQTTKVLDPMFNVPCYGAYFALAPKTTGRVTVYVRQNGVFDDDTSAGRSGKGVYRPQRRVFVMDEMGGFVSSTPELVYPTPWKPETATLKDFDCDLFDLKAADKKDITQFNTTDDNIRTPEDWIKSHFLGLQSFTMSKTNFKNGVYASNLPTDVTHNQAQINRTDKDGNVTDISARGWSVLSVAPVSYTFDVKPGKTYYIYNYGSKLGLYGFVFRKGSPTVDNREWSEDSAPEIAKTEANHVAKVSIDRGFKAGIWNACVLPFSMNRQQIGNVFGPCDDKNNPGGTQILYFDHTEGSTIHFVRHAYNTIVAGKPFLIKPTKDAVISSENMGEFPYVTIESTSAENFGKDKENASYYWTSSYAPFTVAPGDYFLRDTEINGKPADGNMVRYPVAKASGLSMNGFRGYLTAKTENLRQSAKALTIAINDFESDETTYIENVEIAEDGTLRQRLSGKVYNLQGQLVSNDASQLDSLPKGIYIVNGTKVSVK